MSVSLPWTPVLFWGLVGIALCGRAVPAAGQLPDSTAERARADARAAAGDSLRAARQWADARATYRQARALYQTIGEEVEAAGMKGKVGIAYYLDGQLEAARSAFRQAATEAQRAGARAEAANNLNNVGLVEWRRGRYDAALTHLREAVRIHRTLGNRDRVAAGRNNIANVQEERGQYDAALENLRAALEVNRTQKDTADVASNLNNMGLVLRSQGRYEEALATLRTVLRMNRATDDRAGVAVNLSEIGEIYEKQAEYEKAQRFYEQALRVNRELGRREGTALTLSHLGEIHLTAGRHAAADSVLRESIRITEALLRTASGANRRDFLAKEIQRYQALTTVRARARRPDAALRTYERSRARLLAERLSATEDSSRAVPPVDSLRAPVGPDEAAVLYANSGPERPLLVMVVTRDSVETREVAAGPVRRAARRHDAALDRLRAKEEMPWIEQRASLLREAKGVEAGRGAEGALANLVRLYRHDLSVAPRQQLLSPERRRGLGQVLYTVLIDPIEGALSQVNGLVVVPDGALNYLPFEALSDWDRTRLVERWRVRYTQSLRVLHLLQRRDRPSEPVDRRPLLALGGIEYDAAGSATDSSAAGDSRAPGRRTRPGDLADSSASRSGEDVGRTSTYRRLGYGPERWQNIPGTLSEARALRRITGEARLLTGTDASERAVYQLSDRKQLDEYRAVHFATHGVLVPDDPRLSALVLSEVGRTASSETAALADTVRRGGRGADGYLSMREIARLDLSAEFVGLSACRTGLGRIYRGSGAVSLAQAFLRAGAASTAVSLWSVYDASTSRFMEALYRRAWGHDASWAEAMAQTKRAFLDGHYGERLRAPRFWAPFVHYGRDAGRSEGGD